MSKGGAPYIPPPPEPGSVNPKAWDEHVSQTLNKLHKLYTDNVMPVEREFKYDLFRPSWFSDAVRLKCPLALFVGPFSSGKSSFINYLLQGNVLPVGPQPTTDKFTVIMHGNSVERISGRVLVSNPDTPFRGLTQFGDAFIDSLEAVTYPHPLLRSLTLVDTPGVLEAAGDFRRRRYDYVKVIRWMVERSDIVFVLFDPAKLDTGPELMSLFRTALSSCRGKLRVVLNKSDTVSAQELLRVYGSLFWSLSAIVETTEPPRVYVSSFWNKPYQPDTDHELFASEKADLLDELIDTVPRQSLDNRVSSVVKRTTDVLQHALICSMLSSKMPMFGKKKAQEKELTRLPESVKSLGQEYNFIMNTENLQKNYAEFYQHGKMTEFHGLERLKKNKTVEKLQRLVAKDLPELLKPLQNTVVADPSNRKQRIMVMARYGLYNREDRLETDETQENNLDRRDINAEERYCDSNDEISNSLEENERGKKYN